MSVRRATTTTHVPYETMRLTCRSSSYNGDPGHQPSRLLVPSFSQNQNSDHKTAKCAIVDGSNAISGFKKNAIEKMKNK